MQTLLSVVDSTAIMAGLALVYGEVRRHTTFAAARKVLMGAAFGLGAVCSMHQPVLVSGEMIIDCRLLFLGFAGAFLGSEGAIMAFVVAAVGRLEIGVSPAAYAGVCGLLIAAAAGMVWNRVCKRNGYFLRFVPLGAMVSLSFVTMLAVPNFWTSTSPIQAILAISAYNVFGAMVFGSFLSREEAQASREALAQEAASTDPLTGVLNRRGFSRRFAKAEASQNSRGSALLLVDLDHFKTVNDTYGHPAGDLILKQVGDRIKKTIRSEDIVVRAGGEEFGVLLTDVDEFSARASAYRIQAALSHPCAITDQRSVKVTASIGGFFWTTGAVSEEIATSAADKALYSAKALGRDRVLFEMRSTA